MRQAHNQGYVFGFKNDLLMRPRPADGNFIENFEPSHSDQFGALEKRDSENHDSGAASERNNQSSSICDMEMSEPT